MLRRARIKARSASAPARSSRGGSGSRSSGETPRPVTATLPAGQTIMQWPQAMQPKGLSLRIRTRPSSMLRTSAGQMVAHAPQRVQIVSSIRTVPASR
jgi:hypothetical protein